MHLIEKFWNHLRNSDGDDLMWTLLTGFFVLSLAFVGFTLVWIIVDWLGVFVLAVPIIIAILLLIFYGIGYLVIKKFDSWPQ